MEEGGRGGSCGGAKRRRKNNFRPPYKTPGNLKGDKQQSGGQMTSCGSRICWDGDRGRPGGRMNLCGGYVGY